MSTDNRYHGYRYLVDAKNARQYAIRYDNGRPVAPIMHFEGQLDRNETVFALDDETTYQQKNGRLVVSAVAFQLTTDAGAEIKNAKSVGVDYEINMQPQPGGGVKLIYTLTPQSRADMAELGFSTGFPHEFKQDFKANDPGIRRTEQGFALEPRFLQSLSFPPHHDGGAIVARRNVDISMDTTTTAPQPGRAPVVRRPAEPFNNNGRNPAAPRQNERFKVPDAAIESVLNQFGTDLTERAAKGKLDPVVGRDDETRAAIKVMSRRKQASICFTGDAGVGKTAMFSSVAQYIANDEGVPDTLRGARVIEIDLQAMNAGAKFRGQFEEKLKPLIDGLKEREGWFRGRKVILAIDEIHSQLTAGKAEGGSDAGNMMKPFLTAKGISTMGTTTGEEYRKHIEKDPALASRFEQMVLDQPDKESTLTILKKIWPLLKEHHGLAEDLAEEDFEYLVNMTNRYAPNEAQPRKGEKALDMAGASARFRGVNVIEREDIIAAVSQMSKLSADFLNQSDHERFLQMEEELPQQVLGQPGIKRVTDGLIGSRSGLNDPNQPWGAFVLQGPTGTGKTELCKALARYMFGTEDALIQLNMGEYSEKHSVARLIGAPPGYVGFDTAEPALTEKIRQRPYAILLLDEIEKAHPDVFNVLLPVLNDGKMKDNQGKTVLFNNVIVVMTTNLGAKEAMVRLEGGGGMSFGAAGMQDLTPEQQQEELGAIYEKARGSFFRPEMINRIEELGGFVTFIPLAPTVIENLVDREVDKVQKRLNDATGAGLKGVSIELSDEVKAQLATEGYKPDMGARPLRKVIREKIGNPLGKWLMAHKADVAQMVAESGAVKIVIDSLATGFAPKLETPLLETAAAAEKPAAPAANDDAPEAEAAPKATPRKKSNGGGPKP